MRSASRPIFLAPPRMDGFSIVELMVAVTISILLLAGVVSIFASSRTSYETTDRLSRIQENGRFALDELSRDIRSAGYVGCARAPTYLSSSLNDQTTLQWNFLEGPVRGYESAGVGAWAPALDAGVVNPSDGSDILVLRIPRRDAEPMRLQADMVAGTDPIIVPNVTTGVRVNDIALAYSCEAHAYFQVTGFAGGTITHAASGTSPGNAFDTLNYAFRRNAEVVPVQTVVYYVRASTAAEAGIGPADATSLYRRVGAGAAEEIVEGVQRMQLQFGLDTNNDRIVDDYVTADAVTSWDAVYTVSVALLIRALEENGPDTDQRAYQLLDTTVPAPGDRRIREVFTTTANIRNRVPVD